MNDNKTDSQGQEDIKPSAARHAYAPSGKSKTRTLAIYVLCILAIAAIIQIPLIATDFVGLWMIDHMLPGPGVLPTSQITKWFAPIAAFGLGFWGSGWLLGLLLVTATEKAGCRSRNIESGALIVSIILSVAIRLLVVQIALGKLSGPDLTAMPAMFWIKTVLGFAFFAVAAFTGLSQTKGKE